jgi:hypothetical protein
MIASTVLIVLLMMGAESTQKMYSNLAEKNKYNCLKLHHVGYLIKQIDGARNHRYKNLHTSFKKFPEFAGIIYRNC